MMALGIDPGGKTFHWAIVSCAFEDGKLSESWYVDSGTYDIYKVDRGWKDQQINDAAFELGGRAWRHDTVVGIELVPNANNNERFRELVEVTAWIQSSLRAHVSAPQVLLYPAEWKRLALGEGKGGTKAKNVASLLPFEDSTSWRQLRDSIPVDQACAAAIAIGAARVIAGDE